MSYLGNITNKKNITEYSNAVTTKPMVSVVVTTYNHEKYITQCLDSIVAQVTNFDYEVVLGEDSSSDTTRSICIEYANKYPDKIRLFLHDRENVIYIGDQPTGRYNLLHGLQASRGKYIALCEGDDYWTDPSKLQKQVNLMESDSDCAVCFHPVRRIQEGVTEDSIYPKITQDSKFTVKELLHSNFIQTNSVLYRKQDYTKLADDIKCIMPADWYLHLFHAQFGSIAYVNESMSVYRRHDGGIWWDKANVWEKYGEGHLVLYDALKKLYTGEKEREIIDSNISLAITQILRYAGEGSFSIDAIIENHRKSLTIHVEDIIKKERDIDELKSKLHKAKGDIKRIKEENAAHTDAFVRKISSLELMAYSNSYKIGRKITFPIRVLKRTKSRVGKERVRYTNIAHIKRVIKNTYGLKVVGPAMRADVALVIRSIEHPTSSTFIRLLSPLSSYVTKPKIQLVDGDNPVLMKGVRSVIVQRTAIIDESTAKKIVDFTNRNKIPLFVDTDDAFGELEEDHPQYNLQKERVKALDYAINHADEVWFSTEKLASQYKVNKSAVIKNTIDERLWKKVRDNTVSVPEDSEPLHMVYMGTKTHDDDFMVIKPALDALHEKYPGEFDLTVIGVGDISDHASWIRIKNPTSGLYPEFVDWFSSQEAFDIGLSPLYKNSFNANKSDIKCLDYMSIGVQPIVSDVVAYKNSDLDEHIVRVENTYEQWYRILEDQIKNKVKYRKQARKRVEQGYKYLLHSRLSSSAGDILHRKLKW